MTEKKENENLIINSENNKKKAFLIASYHGASGKILCVEHLDELQELVETYGLETVGKEPCPLRKYDASTFLSKGKLEEVVEKAKQLDADLIVFDDEITPAQQRNLEEAFKKPVMDRAEIILGVFGQRAQTKEARLQIELAKVKYEAPRLKRLWTHLSRQQGTGGAGGSGGYLKGEGEKQIEIDRRIIKRKIDLLQKEIEEVKGNRETQRSARERSEIPLFAIIGYTNAGKSTLLNALTHSNVFVEDKLFATLDTTTRKFTLKNNQDILLIDTVGFIRKLPHQLIAAFRSTLEEALQADILLHLIDASHPLAEEHAETTYEVLKELSAGNKPIISVFNKIDVADDPALIRRLRMTYPKNVQISALTHLGFDELQEIMIQELSKQRKIVNLKIPQSDYANVSEIIRLGNILAQNYEENDILLTADLPNVLVNKFSRYLVETEPK